MPQERTNLEDLPRRDAISDDQAKENDAIRCQPEQALRRDEQAQHLVDSEGEGEGDDCSHENESDLRMFASFRLPQVARTHDDEDKNRAGEIGRVKVNSRPINRDRWSDVAASRSFEPRSTQEEVSRG